MKGQNKGHPQGIEVNDAQSKLNSTFVRSLVKPSSLHQIQQLLQDANRLGLSVSIAGGRHAMGGQQFGSDSLLLDMSNFNEIIALDQDNGLLEVQSGIEWPKLIGYLHQHSKGERPWAIRQKQTGVDKVSIGGSLSANIHGRGIDFPPFVSDIESLTLLDAGGQLQTCSRDNNSELFSLAIGGYGLFGVVVHVTLRLVPRIKVKRIVEIIAVKDLIPLIERRQQEGYLYGDCQYSIDLSNEAEEHPGVLSCYKPIDDEGPLPRAQKSLSPEAWKNLYTLARSDKRRAFEVYSQYYLQTNGQVYWSDSHQLSKVFEGYLEAIDESKGTEMITEVYVKRDLLNSFLAKVRSDFIEYEVDMTYGTIRFVAEDRESFLAWATEPLVCIVCNLHVVHSNVGIQKARADFSRIIDRVLEFGGRFFLTYHRWITREQLEAGYPQFREFLDLKLKYDPEERFQSDWYRYYKKLFAM